MTGHATTTLPWLFIFYGVMWSLRSGGGGGAVVSGYCTRHHAASLRPRLALYAKKKTSRPPKGSDAVSLQKRLSLLQEQIVTLNGGRPMNVQSPRQVSQALFGTGSRNSVNKQALMQAMPTLPPAKQQLAARVLEYRQLLRQQQKEQKEKHVPPLGCVARRQELIQAMATLQHSFSATSNTRQFSSERAVVVDQEASDSVLVVSDVAESRQLSGFEQEVDALFAAPGCQVSGYWKQPLMEVSKPSAQAMVRQLDMTLCPMGYDPSALPNHQRQRHRVTTSNNKKKNTAANPPPFLKTCRDQKRAFPDCLLLTRCGDFYESFGVDAVLLVEHAGLNPMAGKAKAGCPKSNVQAYLDRLTARGFSVCIVEESKGATKRGAIKDRFLSQIVSPACPDYLYDLNMKDDLSSSSEMQEHQHYSRPFVGVLHLAAGYTIVEIGLDDQKIRVLERYTAQAVADHFAVHPPADPLWFVPSVGEYEESTGYDVASFLPRCFGHSNSERACDRDLRIKRLSPFLLPDATPDTTDAQRAASYILSAVLKEDQIHYFGDDARPLAAGDFTLVQQQQQQSEQQQVRRTRPLQLETATQLGLLRENNKAIPSLLSHMLPARAPAATRRMVQRWLLTPPPPAVALAMANLVEMEQRRETAFPPLPSVPAIGRLLALLRTGQASAPVYGEIYSTLRAVPTLLAHLQNTTSPTDDDLTAVDSMLTVLGYETGLPCSDPFRLQESCSNAADCIHRVIAAGVLSLASTHHQPNHPEIFEDSVSACLPQEFAERNELCWRGRVQRLVAVEAYEQVEHTARELGQSIDEDFGSLEVVYDSKNNLLSVRAADLKKLETDSDEFLHPLGSDGKLIKSKFTTARVQQNLSAYLSACDEAQRSVSCVLKELSQTLHDQGHVPAIVQAAHTSLIASTVRHHAAKAHALGWNRVAVDDIRPTDVEREHKLAFRNLWPYWMNQLDSVQNNIEMEGMWVLTAPNMSGKSTLMRSTAAAALLGVCGFCAPLDAGSSLERFDNIFVRGASADVPSEGKSAFGAEMGDVASLLSCCTGQSLVFVDELGRGTSPRDGTRLAGAVLEAMATAGMTGIFATHLHDILDLPLRGQERLSNKHMTTTSSNENDIWWTYKLEDGICRDSMALATAERFGVPREILERAEYFTKHLPNLAKQQAGPSSYAINRNGSTKKEDGKKVEHVVRLAEAVTKSRVAVSIPPQWSAPIFLQGKSCLYILEIPHGSDYEYYIGETDNFGQRLLQHRHSKSPNLSSHVFVASHKTQARDWETLLIRDCARAGIPLLSTADAHKSLHSNRHAS